MKRKLFILLLVLAVFILILQSCSTKQSCSTEQEENKIIETDASKTSEDNMEDNIETEISATEAIPVVTEQPFIDPSTIYEYQAEEARRFGGVKIGKSIKGFTGSGYLEGFANDGDYCAFDVEIEVSGFYDLNFISVGIGSYKENYVVINGETAGVVSVNDKVFEDSVIKRIYLEKGENFIELKKYWGWIALDKLVITPSKSIDPEIYSVSAQLINPDADDNAKRLMKYLTDVYGKKILTGQTAQKGISSFEVKTIYEVTGKYPAVIGFDMIDYSPSRVNNGANSDAVEKAIEFDKKGGIVTFCWHWNAPEKYITGIWWSAFYTNAAADINLADIMNGKDPEGYDLLIEDIDAIAAQLKRLQDAGVPVLWRPLHEASGGWFWWGAAGPEACKELWILLYDRLTNHHKLNNLIWLWNGQAADWYPGDKYVDIIGEDIYAGERVYSPQTDKFLKAASYIEKERKMVVLSENGTVFDFDLALRDGAMWGFYAVWNGEFVLEKNDKTGYSEKYTEKNILIKAYTHNISVTLEDLPDLKNYALK